MKRKRTTNQEKGMATEDLLRKAIDFHWQRHLSFQEDKELLHDITAFLRQLPEISEDFRQEPAPDQRMAIVEACATAVLISQLHGQSPLERQRAFFRSRLTEEEQQ
jgi:hypothetical protein